jgi:TetR/AcrR family transcriptional regulator of autoinduction and epiphytic fitness
VRTGAASTLVDLGHRSTDGRVARGIRAREAIAQALIELLHEGVERPTARQLAEHAGVSPRLVFHHFEDMESVLRSAVAIQVERHWAKLEVVPPDGDLAHRVRATVRERARLYEAIAPVRRAAGLAAGRSPTLTRQLEASRRMLRSQLRHTFARELEAYGCGATAAAERNLLDALDVTTSFETWDQLRRQSGRSATAARHVVERLVVGALTFEQQALPPRRSPAEELN